MASSSWEALGESFYRRQEIYSMQWSVNALSDYIIAGARWGGPLGKFISCAGACYAILSLFLFCSWRADSFSSFLSSRFLPYLAMIRDDRKPVLLGKSDVSKRKISVYTSAGGLLQTIQVSLLIILSLLMVLSLARGLARGSY